MFRKTLLFGIAIISLTALFGQTDNGFKDSLEQDLLDEITVIAPTPPNIEIGAYSRIGNFPLGIHFGASRTSNRDNIAIDFATNGNKNQFYSVKYTPNYIFIKSWLNHTINPYIKGIGFLTKNYEFNRFEFANSFNIAGLFCLNVGAWTDQNFKKALPSLGLTKDLRLNRLIFDSSFLEFKTYLDKERIDWSIDYKFELYNKNYRRLSGSIGYESLSDYNDFIVQLSYKYYFIDRKTHK